MRKFLALLVLLCSIGIGSWAETVVTNPATEMLDGTYITLQCMDNNGGDEYYFNGNAVKSQTRSFDNIYKIVSNGADAFYLQRVSDSKYVGKSGDAVTMEDETSSAAAFTFSIESATGWTTYNSAKYTNGTSTVRFTTSGTYLNTQNTGGTPKYAGGTGGYSIWYVKTYTQAEVFKLAPPPFTFTNWTYNSFERIGGTEGTASYVCNNPVYLEQKGVAITNEGDLTLAFQYTSGGKRLEIYGIELIPESSGTYCSKFGHIFAGSGAAKTYALENVTAGIYTLRVWSSEYGDGNSNIINGASNGTISYSGTAAEGVDFTLKSWGNGSFKKTGVLIPTSVATVVKEKGWKTYTNIHYHDDENITLSNTTSYNINYNYTGRDGGGNERMDIRGVEVLDADGNIVSCDYHDGYTGNYASERDYRITIPAGTYTVRTLVQTQYANDVRCKGDITYTVVDGSQIADTYNNSTKPSFYNGDVLKIGAPNLSVLTDFEKLLNEGNDFEIKAAYEAMMTTSNLNLPSGYYYMKGMDATRFPYLYTNLSQANKTYHTGTKNNENKFIWKVTRKSDNSGIELINGTGKVLVMNDGTSFNALTFGAYNGKEGIYFTQGINLTAWGNNSGLVTWTAGGANPADNRWTFEAVENMNCYNVVVSGADGYVTYTANDVEQTAYNNGFFNATSIEESEVSAQDILGYNKSIDISGNTITVTYTYKENHPYLVFKCERGGIIANTNGNLTTGTYDESADNQKFLLVNIENKNYLYNSSLQKFVTSPASGNTFALVNYPHDAFTTTDATSPNGDYNTILKINNTTMNNNNAGSMVNGWETEDEGNRFMVNEVGGISDDEYAAIVVAIKAACDAKKTSMAAQNESYGTAYGQYSWTNKTATDEAVATANALDTEANNYYTSLFAEIRKFDIAYIPTLNMPQPGSFLRIKGNSSNYLTLPDAGTFGKMKAEGDILCYTAERNLVSYNSGLGIYNTHTVAPIGSTLNVITFMAGEGQGKYQIQSDYTGGGQFFYDHTGYTGGDILNRNGSATNVAQCQWTLEEVTTLPVTITAAGYATLYAPVALEIPEGVTAYTGTIKDNVFKLNPIEGIIPANTGVILKSNSELSEPTVFNFDITTGDTGSSDLTGTIPSIANKENAYTLQMGDKGIGLYKNKANLIGFKAYLELPEEAGSNGFKLVIDDDDLTGLNGIGVNTPADGIYRDLLGNPVAQPQKGQILILNGNIIKY